MSIPPPHGLSRFLRNYVKSNYIADVIICIL